MGYRISVDVGGTFTDLTIAYEDILMGRYKSPTTPQYLTQGVFNCLGLAAADLKIEIEDLLSQTDVFVHGSTIATNTMLEDKGAKCGVICTKGTKYTLWKGEGRRKDIFNFKTRHQRPLIHPYLCLEITERINSEGEILLPLNKGEVRAAIYQFKKWNVKAIAVCLLWSVVNSIHEQRIGEIIEEEWPGVFYSLSSEIQPILREYHRMSCVVLNSMLQPIVSEYLGNLQRNLAENRFRGELLIVISDGGVVPVEEVTKRPVFMLFSGPSTAPLAGSYFAKHEERENCLIIDMGGTSFDVSTVVGGRITTTRDGRILNYPTGISATEVLTLGAGGGSIASIDPAGMLMVGPRSAGAEPGPVCYMRGGTEPTVTDAYVALGYIVPDHFLGGKMNISPESARKVIKDKIADPLKLTVEKAALGICQVVNEKMVNGIFDMTVRRGIDPRELIIVTGGGATPIPVARLAQELKVKQVIIPRETAVLCAFGAQNADIALNAVASRYTDTRTFDYNGVNEVLEKLEKRGSVFLDHLGAVPENRKIEIYCAARYPMQVTELEIPLSDNRVNEEVISALARDFHGAHLARYKTADPESDVEFVMWKCIARKLIPKIELPKQISGRGDASKALTGTQLAYFEESEEFLEIPYYDGDTLCYGMEIHGPALVVLPDTTIVIPPKFRILTGERGYYIMDVPI
jgi:N-methylhydantoinase A